MNVMDNNKKMCQTVEEANDNICKEIRRVMSASKKQVKTAYADTVKKCYARDKKTCFPHYKIE